MAVIADRGHKCLLYVRLAGVGVLGEVAVTWVLKSP